MSGWMLAVAIGTAGAAEPGIPLAAHHARYKLSLLKSEGSKAPAAVDGLIEYDFTGSSCEGYAMTFRQLTELQPSEGESRLSDMKSATFEDGVGKQFRFDTQTTYSGGSSDGVLGAALKNSDGTVAVDLQKPEAAKVALASALFPTEHLQKVLEAARAGSKTLSAPVYDGSETGRKVYDTFTVIGAPTTASTTDKANDIDVLKTMRRWPVSISYFEQGKDIEPAYVMAFELYDDGISRALKLDYGSFTLVGSLVDLKLLPPTVCPTH